MTIAVPASNAALIQSEVQQLLVQPLQQSSTFLAAGPVIIDSTSPVRIPRVSSVSEPGFVAAGAQIPDTGVGFDEIDALPSSMQALKSWVPISNELIRGSAVNGLSAILQARVVTDMANKLDDALYNGTGASNTIKGILAQTGIQTGTLDTADLNSVLDGLGLLFAANAQPSRIFANPSDYTALRKIKTTQGEYVLDPDAHADTQYSLFGVPVTLTNRLAAGKLLITDQRYVVVVRDSAPSVFVSTERLADFDSVAIRTVCRYDLAVTQPEAVVVLTKASG
ncbi:phage major capsid protein [Mycobacterium terramassiliense]|nr:phage major capsid protein [Mycobacterium terramassiliense]